MSDGDAAARGERQLLGDAPVLPQVFVDGEDLRHGPERWIADRQAADFARRRQVALGQHRRDGQNVGDVVETVTRIVGRKQQIRVDIEREKIADRVGVLGPIQPMNRGPAAWIGSGFGGAIERRLEIVNEGIVSGFVGTGTVERRHRARAQFARDLLPHFGVIGDALDIAQIENKVPRLELGIVTGDAMPAEEGTVV